MVNMSCATYEQTSLLRVKKTKIVAPMLVDAEFMLSYTLNLSS